MQFLLALVLALCAGLVPARAQPTSGHRGLGVLASDLPPDAPLRGGAWVHKLVPRSAAEAAGLRPNDVIVAVDGTPAQDVQALGAAMAALGPDRRVTIRLLRPAGGGATPPQAARTATVPVAPAVPQAVSRTVAWTRFVDPNEHGFSLEIPAG